MKEKANIICDQCKVENTSDSISFKIMLEVVKYVIVSVVALLCGVLFVNIAYGNSVFWLAFGVLLGGFIAFLITNAILYKSVHKVFKGIVGFIVISVILSAVLIFISFQALGVGNNIPYVGVINSVNFYVEDYVDIELTERESIETIIEFVRCIESGERQNSPTERNKTTDYYYAGLSDEERLTQTSKNSISEHIIPDECLGNVLMEFKTKFGQTVEKEYYIYDKYAYFEEIRNVLNLEEFSEKYVYVDSEYSGSFQESDVGSVNIGSDIFGIESEAVNCIRNIGKVDFDYFQNNPIGTYCSYDDETYRYSLHAILRDNETAIKYREVEFYDKRIDNFINNLNDIKVIDNSDDTYKIYTDREQIKSILTSSHFVFTNEFSFTEKDFTVVFVSGNDIYVTEFLYGKIPEFVK